ncbi:MAG: nicotinamide riboside transporter PnuC [Lentimicrobiaceae bacterium]|jgi:nicotinamide mononucleotide transporter|nr:nicotinamide riboside transporter PnuC [Lentimicrobiaceae bacterium]
MDLVEIYNQFIDNILQTSWIEAIAVICGLLSVWYSKKLNILVYPTGIISVLLYVYICYVFGLYADMGINFVYFVMSGYGWYRWTHPGKNSETKELPVTFLKLKGQIIGIVATLVFFLILSYVLKNYTDSTVPYVDSFTTAVFIIGMYLMAVKKVENWIYWIIGDIISIPLYFYKGLVFTSFQYLVFLLIAVSAFFDWKKAAVKSNA